jgi:hypothetical protein
MATATATASAGAAAAQSESSRQLVQAALAKLGSVEGTQRAKLEELVGKLKSAVARGDAGESARLDGELTNYLFELD